MPKGASLFCSAPAAGRFSYPGTYSVENRHCQSNTACAKAGSALELFRLPKGLVKLRSVGCSSSKAGLNMACEGTHDGMMHYVKREGKKKTVWFCVASLLRCDAMQHEPCCDAACEPCPVRTLRSRVQKPQRGYP